MNLQERIGLLQQLGEYLKAGTPEWREAVTRAGQENGWFTEAFVNRAADAIVRNYLQRDALERWAAGYDLPEQRPFPRRTGIVMAGNIPLVGFHDWLSVFISGHQAVVKPASQDNRLIRHITDVLAGWHPDAGSQTTYAEMLKGCDAYLATGSNNSSRYFEYYFGKYPHLIRRNKTAAALLTGTESPEHLRALADDVHTYFGRGCRNVTKLYVPRHYDFVPLLDAFRSYAHLSEHHKYRNNYDYQLALLLLNKRYYMTNGTLLLTEDPALFAPISQLHYEYYDDPEQTLETLRSHPDLQCIAGPVLPFGCTQEPGLTDYADGADTLAFLCNLP
ncbi:MAG: hypothetical protein RJA57_654 [Bacteroidota bacterium]|jgi:hypothetical protein